MAIKYSRPILLAVLLITMCAPASFAAKKHSREHKRCVENCKVTRRSATDACRSMRGRERKQCVRSAKEAFRSCKNGCPR
jgi:hypothetical protein